MHATHYKYIVTVLCWVSLSNILNEIMLAVHGMHDYAIHN